MCGDNIGRRLSSALTLQRKLPVRARVDECAVQWVVEAVMNVDLIVPLSRHLAGVPESSDRRQLFHRLGRVVLVYCEKLTHTVREDAHIGTGHVIQVAEHTWQNALRFRLEDSKGLCR